MSRSPVLALFFLVAFAGCAESAGSSAPAASPTAAAPTPEASSDAPRATPRCPTDTTGTEDPKGYVSATANIFGAGHAVPPGDGPGKLPPVFLLPAGVAGWAVITFPVVTGCLNFISDDGSGGTWNGPEGAGGGNTDITSIGGISGIVFQHNAMFLVGVFLSDAEPSGDGPARLEFTEGQTFDVLEPLLGQTFFIGNGVGRGYRIPAEATRLFLGFADAAGFQGLPGDYSNNAGEAYFKVKIDTE